MELQQGGQDNGWNVVSTTPMPRQGGGQAPMPKNDGWNVVSTAPVTAPRPAYVPPAGNVIRSTPGTQGEGDLWPSGLSPSTAWSNFTGNLSSLGHRVQGVVANSPLGYTAESTFPKVADALGIHPTDTPSAPGYSSDPGSRAIVPVQNLMPGNPTSGVGHVAKGVLRGAGQLATAKNLSTGVGVAATGGLVAPLAAGAGAVGTVARLGTQGARLAAAGVGAKNAYDDATNAYQQYKAGDTGGALESAGAALPGAALTLPAFGKPIEAVGDAMQRGGVNLINQTAGARTKNFAHGASPGQGYFDAGFGPSVSMRSIADKAGSALESTGQTIGGLTSGASQSGALIPYEAGAAPILDAITRTRASLTGPGGTGNSAALNDYEATWKPLLAAAQERGGFDPSEYHQAKVNTARNTTWGDPMQAGMKDLRQSTVGGMGGALVSTIPDLADKNSTYQNLLQLRNITKERADTGSMALPAVVNKLGMGLLGAGSGAISHNPYLALGTGVAASALDSVPVRTSIASGLYYGGKGLSIAGAKLPSLIPSLGTGSGNDGLPSNPEDYSNQSQNGNQHSASPLSASYPRTLPVPEIIRPGDLSRSRFGVGPDGRSGVLIRPLGGLPAPSPLSPTPTPYAFNPAPPMAIPGRSALSLTPSIGSRAPLLPSSILGPVFTPGTPEEEAAALRLSQLGSAGNLLPTRIALPPPIRKPGAR